MNAYKVSFTVNGESHGFYYNFAHTLSEKDLKTLARIAVDEYMADQNIDEEYRNLSIECMIEKNL